MASNSIAPFASDLPDTSLSAKDLSTENTSSEVALTPPSNTHDSLSMPSEAAETKNPVKASKVKRRRRREAVEKIDGGDDRETDYSYDSSDSCSSASASIQYKSHDSGDSSSSEAESDSRSGRNKTKKTKREKRLGHRKRSDKKKTHRTRKQALRSAGDDDSSSESSTSNTSSGASSSGEQAKEEGTDEVKWLRQQLEIRTAPAPTAASPQGYYLVPISGCAPTSTPQRPGLALDKPRVPPPKKPISDKKKGASRKASKPKDKSKKGYRRVDSVWDNNLHNFKLQETKEAVVEDKDDPEYAFQVCRSFDTDGRYEFTLVHIMSKPLQEVARHVIGNIQGVNLMDSVPKLNPNTLFLYLDDFEQYAKELKQMTPEGDTSKERRKNKAKLSTKMDHLKWLISYVNEDYSSLKKSLATMLSNGLITFDLIWALWKPSTIAYTSTYGSNDSPRAFKIRSCQKLHHFNSGPFWLVSGKYLDFNGKHFGHCSMQERIDEFHGARKITSLPVYPLRFHKHKDAITEKLIARGKDFVDLCGVNYREYKGMAYCKRKNDILRVNVKGRVMVDAATHRRINPNYDSCNIPQRDGSTESADDYGEEESSDVEDGSANNSNSRLDEFYGRTNPQASARKFELLKEGDTAGKAKSSFQETEAKGETEQEKEDEDGEDGEDEAEGEDQDKMTHKTHGSAAPKKPVFSDQDYLIASPLLLGFSFSEKLWLEFLVSKISEIQWNANAYESLVLAPKTKSIIKALVESHKYNAADSIDDVILGKGKGLVAVLHGPPGTGKTLTAEGISELLKCPLYMASAGELGTYSRCLEGELQKMLDICHAWGAILLLDEADVFLEKRNLHDINRNALVSIFLRQLEYFQGILFLTTNRVESRIHIALRYDNLQPRARQAIFKMFIKKVQDQKPSRELEGCSGTPYQFTEDDFETLGKWDLNGRQIKNTISTAQALSINKKERFSMQHIREVFSVLSAFDQDLKGGPGYEEAMRSYF
ncbi:aaa family atpase [Ceratocystis lukuohia]|uniref:Aaa family atpase n=1 Tax=Ceratocystis lukuohia TaxID=2019550 RepID=A0ABR4M8Q0_9PEZI